MDKEEKNVEDDFEVVDGFELDKIKVPKMSMKPSKKTEDKKESPKEEKQAPEEGEEESEESDAPQKKLNIKRIAIIGSGVFFLLLIIFIVTGILPNPWFGNKVEKLDVKALYYRMGPVVTELANSKKLKITFDIFCVNTGTKAQIEKIHNEIEERLSEILGQEELLEPLQKRNYDLLKATFVKEINTQLKKSIIRKIYITELNTYGD